MAWHHMAAAVALLILTAACTQHRADAVAAVTVATATLIHNSMPRPSSMPLQRPHRALLDLTAQTLETNFTAEHLASSGWMANLSNLISAGDLESFAKAQTAMAVALDLIGKETEEHKTATEETETAVDTMWIMFTGMLVSQRSPAVPHPPHLLHLCSLLFVHLHSSSSSSSLLIFNHGCT